MAVTLTTGGFLDFGDLAAIAGTTELTVAVTVKPSSITGDYRLVGQWGTGTVAFLCHTRGTDDVSLVLADASGNLRGWESTNASMSAGNVYRLVFTYLGGSLPSTMPTVEIWCNGVKLTTALWLNTNAAAVFASLANSGHPVRVGKDSTGSTNTVPGDYSEAAIALRRWSDDECAAYGKGYSPDFFRRSGLIYVPAVNVASLRDVWNGTAITQSTAGDAPGSAEHPRVLYPVPAQVVVPPAVLAARLPRSVFAQPLFPYHAI